MGSSLALVWDVCLGADRRPEGGQPGARWRQWRMDGKIRTRLNCFNFLQVTKLINYMGLSQDCSGGKSSLLDWLGIVLRDNAACVFFVACDRHAITEISVYR